MAPTTKNMKRSSDMGDKKQKAMTTLSWAKGKVPRRRLPEKENATVFVTRYQAAPMELVEIIRRGLSPDDLTSTSAAMHLPQERIFRMLKMPSSTIKRKLASQKRFSPEQSEHLLGLQKLIGQVEVMVAESGRDTRAFNAATWVAQWLDEACPALGNQKPGDFMDTGTGQELVSNLLAQMQSGAYA